jgi:hypothetical protein
MALYNSIGANDVEFELIFAGPNTPDYKLPENFRFIKTPVKPSQCIEIAVRNATAELIMFNLTDDCEFLGARPLDRIYQAYKNCHDDKAILSCRYMMDGEDLSEASHHFNNSDLTSPLMPLAPLMSRRFYRDLGGIDNNFEAIFGDLDITMRAYAAGGKVIMTDVYLNEDKAKRAGSSLCTEFWKHDRGLLESLWMADGKVSFSRARKFEPFSDSDILKYSQGPRGRWRGKGPLLFEKIEDNFPRVVRGIRKPSMYFDYAKRMAIYIKDKAVKNNSREG